MGLKHEYSWDWNKGSVVKALGCSCRRLGFGVSTHVVAYGLSWLQFRWPLLPLTGTRHRMIHRCTCRQNTHTQRRNLRKGYPFNKQGCSFLFFVSRALESFCCFSVLLLEAYLEVEGRFWVRADRAASHEGQSSLGTEVTFWALPSVQCWSGWTPSSLPSNRWWLRIQGFPGGQCPCKRCIGIFGGMILGPICLWAGGIQCVGYRATQGRVVQNRQCPA